MQHEMQHENKKPRDFGVFCMQEMGLEPTRSHPRQILSLMRLPFRHSCASNSDILSQVSSKFKCLFPTKHYFLVIFSNQFIQGFADLKAIKGCEVVMQGLGSADQLYTAVFF